MHLHHRDSNSRNNSIENLVVCTPEEHVEFHRQLGHKIQQNYIFKANFFADMTVEEQEAFRRKASEYSKRRINLSRSDQTRLLCKLNSALQANSLEMIDVETGKIVSEFFSIKEAAEKLDIQRAHIRRVITGERKGWRGYVFRYKEFRNAGHL